MQVIVLGFALLMASLGQSFAQSNDDTCMEAVARLKLTDKDAIKLSYVYCQYFLAVAEERTQRHPTQQRYTLPPLLSPGPLAYLAAPQPLPQMPRMMYCNPNPIGATPGPMICR
jgi:hypothetical protein